MSAQSTAKSEASEESGVRGKIGGRALGSSEYRKKVWGCKIRCRLQLFPLAVRTQAKNGALKGGAPDPLVQNKESGAKMCRSGPGASRSKTTPEDATALM